MTQTAASQWDYPLFAYQVPSEAEPYHSLMLLLAAAHSYIFDRASVSEAVEAIKQWHDTLKAQSSAVYSLAQVILLIAAFALTRQALIDQADKQDEFYRDAYELALSCLYQGRTPFIRVGACFLLHDIAAHSDYHLPSDFYKTKIWESIYRDLLQANISDEWRTMMAPSVQRWRTLFAQNPFAYQPEIQRYVHMILRILVGSENSNQDNQEKNKD